MTRLRWIGGFFVVVVLLLLALPWIVSAEQFRPLIQSQLSAATGRQVEFTSTAILRIENDLIAAAWDEVDLLGLTAQLNAS